MGFEDEAEQSYGRPCRQNDGRSKPTCDLTSSIVPRGTSFHRSVELEFPPIVLDSGGRSCRHDLPGPPKLGAINPDAMLRIIDAEVVIEDVGNGLTGTGGGADQIGKRNG